MWKKEKANRNPFFNDQSLVSVENPDYENDEKHSKRDNKKSFEKTKNYDYESERIT